MPSYTFSLVEFRILPQLLLLPAHSFNGMFGPRACSNAAIAWSDTADLPVSAFVIQRSKIILSVTFFVHLVFRSRMRRPRARTVFSVFFVFRSLIFCVCFSIIPQYVCSSIHWLVHLFVFVDFPFLLDSDRDLQRWLLHN